MTIADRRLHGATVVERAIRALPSIVIGLATVGVSARSDFMRFVPVLALLLVASFVYRWVALSRFRYGVGASEFVIESGVFTRRRRVIPFERIQDVELIRSPIARAIGLAKLRLETGGGGADEGVLDSLGLGEAEALRDELRRVRLGGGAGGVIPAADAPLLFAMDRRRVLTEGLFSPSLVFIAVIMGVAQNLEPLLGDAVSPERWLERGSLDDLPITAARVAAVALAVVALGFASGLVRAFASHHRFTLARADRGFRIRRGLFTLAEAVVPIARVQAIVRRDGPLRRAFGWERLEFQTLGFGARTRRLAAMPFARAGETAPVVAIVHAAEAAPAYRRVSPRYVWRAGLRCLAAALLTGAAASWFWPPAPFAAVALFGAVAVQAWFRWRAHGYALDRGTLYLRRGWLARERWIVPIASAQAFALMRSPLQRWLGLASVAIDTAGASGNYRPRAVDLPFADAEALIAAMRGGLRGGARWSIAGVGDQPLRAKSEGPMRPIDHPALRGDLGLADGGGRLHVHDDRVLQVDQIIGAVGEEGGSRRTAPPNRPAVHPSSLYLPSEIH